jgi:GT2 family glycosyltransferase
MVSRAVYEQVGGFDEELAVAFNDVDFCLKVRDAGLEVVFDASVELYHFESVSRGYEDTEAKMRRFTREVKNMRVRWHKYYENGDPYINSNFIGKEGFNQYYGLPKE